MKIGQKSEPRVRRFHFPPRSRWDATPFPLAPVEDYMTWETPDRFGHSEFPASPRAAIVRHLLTVCDFDNPNSASSKVRHWYERGLTVYEADILAVSLGVHPSAIWPDWFSEEE